MFSSSPSFSFSFSLASSSIVLNRTKSNSVVLPSSSSVFK